MNKSLTLVLLLAVVFLVAFFSGCVQPPEEVPEEPVSEKTLGELSGDIEELESVLADLNELEELEALEIDESLFE